ncbi:MAG: phosphate signaling complex protein PhoU [Ardenticatenaceae bacterium]|nr:phosphate signaling complex protein PhoU [Ardenticatenaceae bacterium]MCB9444842.1 phosphate signaling complex protein PhoU [Ardenticatenaceae bacterium]
MVIRNGKRAILEKQLQGLQTQILTLGSLVSEALLLSSNILKNKDLAGAKTLILADQGINQRWIDIQRNCLRIIATQNPIASDLRFVSACLEIASELERMHDYAKGIAKVTIIMGNETEVVFPNELSQMAQVAQKMLHLALDALIQQNVELALSVAANDDHIDALYEQIYHNLLGLDQQGTWMASHAHHLLWAAHNLERAGDRVTNICEWIVYFVTGQRLEMNTNHDVMSFDFH